MLIFAFGHFISSQEDCVLFKMPGTSEKGGFSPASCSSPLRDPPNSLCLCGLTDPWLCYSQKGPCQGRTGITRILFKYLEDTAGECQSPKLKTP